MCFHQKLEKETDTGMHLTFLNLPQLSLCYYHPSIINIGLDFK